MPVPAPDLLLTDDPIAGPLRVWQRRRGHRYSIDDVVTAWEAVRARPDARLVADLGCGIGSVLTMVAYKLREARVAGVEVQPVALDLARRNVDRNALASRVELLLGDLRDDAVLAELARRGAFDLVTGTPPYVPIGRGTVPPDAQRAAARFELHGGVEAYLRAAARLLAPDGRAVLCAGAGLDERVLAGAAAVDVGVIARREIVPRAITKRALFAVWTFGRDRDATMPGRAIDHAEPLVLRDAAGARTEHAHALRRFFDLPQQT